MQRQKQNIRQYHAFDDTKLLAEIINGIQDILNREEYIDLKWIEDNFFNPDDSTRHFDITIILITRDFVK